MRALAILGIFLAHTSVWLPDEWGMFTNVVGKLGSSSVVTFFMLSGFLLAYKNKFIPNLAKREVIISAWKKVSKMYGLYIITMLVAFLSKWPDAPKYWLQALICLPFQLTMTQAFIPVYWVTNSFNGPAWFLSALFGIWILIYIFPNVVNRLLALPAKRCLVCIIGVLIIQIAWLLFVKSFIYPVFSKSHCLMWGYDWLVYSNPVLCFSEYIVGALIGRICAQRQFTLALQNMSALLAICMMTIFVIMKIEQVRILTIWIVMVECIVCVGLAAIISPKSIGYKVLSSHLLVWFGNISGYFFLIHGAVNFAMRATVENVIPKPWIFFVSLSVSTILSACAGMYYSKKSSSLRVIYNENS